jgi:hypothetical protein
MMWNNNMHEYMMPMMESIELWKREVKIRYLHAT